MYKGVAMYLHAFLSSAVDGSKWPTLVPADLSSGKTECDSHSVGGWLDFEPNMKAEEKWKIPYPWTEQTHDFSAVRPESNHYADWAILVPGGTNSKEYDF